MSETPQDETSQQPKPRSRSRLAWSITAIAIIVVAVVVAISLRAGGGSTASDDATSSATAVEQHEVTITDEAGREVQIEAPVQRAYASYSYTAEFIRALGGGSSIVAIDSSYDPAQSDTNADYWGAFADLPVVSTTTTSKDIDYDALIAADPEVVFFLSNEDYETAASTLEPFGIQVIVVTTSDPSNFQQDLDILAEAYDASDRAEQVQSYYDDITEQLDTRLAGTSAVDVYWENGSADTSVASGSVWQNLIELAGGRNIFEDIDFDDPDQNPEGYNFATPVDPAAILERDPAYVFRLEISSSVSGQTPFDQDYADGVLDELTSRAGWSDLTAVKNKDVFVLNNFLISALNKQLGALTVAALLHPDEFADLDLDEYLHTWVVDFQGVSEADYHAASEYYYQYQG
ncbi:MAG: ABC transporter substrate-binding protein [Microbacteriaceae bacterium]